MRYYEGLTFEQIGQKRTFSKTTASKYHNNGIQKISMYLESPEFFEYTTGESVSQAIQNTKLNYLHRIQSLVRAEHATDPNILTSQALPNIVVIFNDRYGSAAERITLPTDLTELQNQINNINMEFAQPAKSNLLHSLIHKLSETP
jgi:hypothetical protein